jgi:hypothetical protein
VPPIQKTVTALNITPTNPDIKVGGAQAFTATATYSDNSTGDVTSSASWTSTVPSIATIQTTGQASPGLASGISGGPTDIIAQFGGSTADTTLGVQGGTPTGIALGVINPSIAPNSKLQIVDVLQFSDGSDQKVTADTTWTSSNPAVATIES